MEMELNILSGRYGKNIDSTDNVKRGSTIKSEKIGKGETPFFFPNLLYEGVKKCSFFVSGGSIILNSTSPLILAYR